MQTASPVLSHLKGGRKASGSHTQRDWNRASVETPVSEHRRCHQLRFCFCFTHARLEVLWNERRRGVLPRALASSGGFCPRSRRTTACVFSLLVTCTRASDPPAQVWPEGPSSVRGAGGQLLKPRGAFLLQGDGWGSVRLNNKFKRRNSPSEGAMWNFLPHRLSNAKHAKAWVSALLFETRAGSLSAPPQ